MSLILRIHWIAFATFVAGALYSQLSGGPMVQRVPVANCRASVAGFGIMGIYWFAWMSWYSFGPGRAKPPRQAWLFGYPQIVWPAQFPIIAAMWLVWPWADDTTLLVFVIQDMAAMAANAFGSARLPPSKGFGSPLPLLLPAALALFLLTHPRPYSGWIAGWVLVVGAAFLLGREMIEQLLNRAYEANRALATERDAKTRFLASASHDLAYPLQAARLFVDQMEQHPPGPHRDKAARNARWAFATTEHLLQQIGDHLRLEAGREEAVIATVPVGLAIARVAEMTDPAARLARVVLIAMPSSLAVRADAGLLDRALANLVGNALRHAKARRVLIGARRCGTRVRCWVIDDGVGIAAEDIPTLFDEYVQGSDHGGEIRGGFGLGLASTRKTAALMQGTVGLDTRWRHGSAFWLELPRG